jgi:hypothetical protein
MYAISSLFRKARIIFVTLFNLLGNFNEQLTLHTSTPFSALAFSFIEMLTLIKK